MTERREGEEYFDNLRVDEPMRPEVGAELELPYADDGITAGFPSPAQDYMRDSIDLNRELIRHAETTFYARVHGDSMTDAGIFDGDLVIIDKSIEPRSGDIVVAYVDGEFTIKQYREDAAHGCGWLVAANRRYRPICVTSENEFMIWGVVTYTIKRLIGR